MNRFTFVDCGTVDEALSQMKGDAVVKAGGIDLLDLMKDGVVTPPKLVVSGTCIRCTGSSVGKRTAAWTAGDADGDC